MPMSLIVQLFDTSAAAQTRQSEQRHALSLMQMVEFSAPSRRSIAGTWECCHFGDAHKSDKESPVAGRVLSLEF